MRNARNPFSSRGLSCLVVALLTGCGGGDGLPDFPREIGYQNLKSQTGGELLGIGLALSESGITNCTQGKSWCLSSLTSLNSQQQFQAYVTQYASQQLGSEDSKRQLLASGAGIDFSKHQIWAMKLGGVDVASVGLKINETASAIEIQAVTCYSMSLVSSPFLADVFAVVPRDTPAKPVVYLDKSGPFYGPECPLALN